MRNKIILFIALLFTFSYSQAVPLVPSSITVCVGASAPFTRPAVPLIPPGTWTSSNPTVANVSATGVVTGVGVGTATITFTHPAPPGIFTGTVNVIDIPTSVSSSATPNPVCAGTSVTFSGSATGATSYSWSGPLGYSSTLFAPSFTPTGSAESGVYIFHATNSCGSQTAPLVLQVDDAITGIAATPATSTVCAGTLVTFTGSATGATSYTWYDPGATPIGTAMVYSFTPTSSAESGIYMFEATNACGSVNALVSLQVDDPITGVTASASPIVVCDGGTLTLTGTATSATSYSWTGPGGYSSSGGTMTTVTASSTSGGIYTFTATNACGPVSATTASVFVANQWQGTVSTDWFDASNWACRVPLSTDNVYIPSGTTFSPEVNATATAVCYNLVMDDNTILIDASSTLNIGGSVTVNNTTGSPAFNLSASTAVMTIAGNVTSAGSATTKIIGQGYVTLNGSALQTLYGNINIDFMELNNSASSTAAQIGSSGNNGQVTIDNTLKLTVGTLATNSGTYGKLILNSQPASGGVLTARIDQIPSSGGGSVGGDVYCYQYIPGNFRTYIFWSHPFSTPTTLSQLMDASVTGVGGINITGTGTVQGVTTRSTDSCFDGAVSSAYWYNTAATAWVGFQSACPYAQPADQIKRCEGIRVWYRGARPSALYWNAWTPPPSPSVISQWGPVNQGNQNDTLIKVGSSDYNMVGNPYPSPIDIAQICHNDAGSLFGTTLWVWDPVLGTAGQFKAISFSSSSSHYFLPANCAFQVRALNNGTVLHFHESDKTSSVTSDSLMYREIPESVTLNIYDANYHLYDILDIKFDDNATGDEDERYDAGKIIGDDFGFYSKSADGHNLSIDARPYSNGSVIPLVLRSQYEQDFVIKAENLPANIPGPVYLHDKLLNTYTRMEPGAEYKFSFKNDEGTAIKQCIYEEGAGNNFASNDDASSVNSNRFELKMVGNNAITENNNTGLSVALSPNPAKDEVSIIYSASSNSNTSLRIMDVTGMAVITKDLGQISRGNITVSINDLAAGVYIVELTSGNDRVIQKLVKQ